MTDIETLAERLRTVERAVGDGDHVFPGADDVAALESRLDEIESRLDDLEAQTDELDAATQAVRGYVGNVRSVNTDVERRAEAALAATDRLERRIEELTDRNRSEPTRPRPDQEREATGGRTAHPTGESRAWEQSQEIDGLAGEGCGDAEPDSEGGPDGSGLAARISALL